MDSMLLRCSRWVPSDHDMIPSKPAHQRTCVYMTLRIETLQPEHEDLAVACFPGMYYQL